MANRKKSNFPAKTTISGADTLDYVTGGVNYKITYDNFIAGLGVTGTLAQAGSVTSAPVLDTQGTVNNIRNLESGSGVKASISPENGLTLAHNFLFDESGASLTPDSTALQVGIRSLVGSAGISVGAVGDTIQFALTSSPASTKTIIVNSLSDLPAPVVGVITLADSIDYLVANDLVLGLNRFVMGVNTTFRASSQTLITVTCTLGSGDLFTGANRTCEIRDVAFDMTGMRLVNFTGSGTESLTVENVTTIGATSVCNFNGGKNLIVKRVNCDGCADGITLAGTITTVLIQDNLFDTCTSSFLDFGTAVVTDGTAITNQITIGASGYTFKGLANNANIGTTSIFTILNNKTFGTGLGLSNLLTTDTRFQYALNDALSDTRVDGLLSLQGNATNTVIAGAGTPVLVAGTWVVELESQMSATTAGRIIMDSVKGGRVPMAATLSLSPVSGGAKTISVHFAINGSVIANSKRSGSASGGTDILITCLWQADLATNDYVEVFVTNEDDAVDILVSSAVLQVN